MKLRSIIAGIAAGAMLSTGALAADYSTYSAATFDWDGFYAGLGITGGAFMTGPAPSNYASIDGIAGVNMTSGAALFGVEGQLSGVNDFTNGWMWSAKGEFRAGYLAAPEALIYGAVAAKAYSGGARYIGLGAGVEFVAVDNMTFDIEGVYYPWSNNAYDSAEISASALWHF